MTIRVKRKIDSDTLHIPELKSMIGREVEVVVTERGESALDRVDPKAFWERKTVQQLAQEQGVGKYQFDDPNRYVFSDDDFEGFEDALRQWRKE
jgi:hypothetical protein